ncbi:adenylyltransferase/cytidyltransferase family protein [Selenomonas montiformis]|nr:adenylyltransferase/cytidyltransferase family protein [Selenomonas montiformis]
MADVSSIIRRVQAGILSWYGFRNDQSVLYVGGEEEPVYEYLTRLQGERKIKTVTRISPASSADFHKLAQKYDYAISIAALEKTKDISAIIGQMSKALCRGGHLLLGMNNRLGIRYFCGDRDIYTQRNFDGIENYRRSYAKETDTFYGRMYDFAEIRSMLQDAGWSDDDMVSYSVYSGLDYPQYIFSEGFVPNEDLINRIRPKYGYPDAVFLEEERLYAGLMDNGMFHQMANAYLFDCSVGQKKENLILEVSNALERVPEHAFSTILTREGVQKKAYDARANASLRLLESNSKLLMDRDIPVVAGRYHEVDGLGIYSSEFIHAETGRGTLTSTAAESSDRFFELMDMFMAELERSSDLKMLSERDIADAIRSLLAHGMNPRETADMERMLRSGKALQNGLFDFVPINSFYVHGRFQMFDQEFLLANLPLDVMKWRVIATVYAGNELLEQLIPMDDVLHRYGIYEKRKILQTYELLYLEHIRNDNTLKSYYLKHCVDYNTVNDNRQRLNFSAGEYRRIFVDIFEHADSRKLILFGSGNYAKEFIEVYGEDYAISAIVDNNQNVWDTELKGISIYSPDYLKKLESGTYKVIVCIKNYLSVLNQIREMGVTDYGVFNPAVGYQRKTRPLETMKISDVVAKHKKYHVGYIAGVFDLFHIGHLNMFKRAKEQCEYLIVGVVPDEDVIASKHTEPFVPFDERIEMVRSCRYVDEAVRIPVGYGDTDVAWRSLHFDVQFSGSDYEHDPVWLRKKEWLEERGSTMVFFPYTQSTSSTKLKKLIAERLI